MSDVAKPKAKKASKPKAAAAHPTYLVMTKAAIAALKERNGSSRQAILKYIMANYKLGNDQKPVNSRLKVALRNGTKSGALKHHGKATGANGSFKLGEKATKAAKPKPKKATKPKAAKPKTPKKKAASGDKKAKAKKTPKKTAAKPKKSPAKKAAKPKATPKKAAPKKAAKPKKSPKKTTKAKKPAAKK